MAWPTTAVATGELITAAQMNGLPVRIADTTLAADAASISFTSIPGHYAHLLVVAYLRGDTAAANVSARIRFNADTGSNYDWQSILGSAATASAGETFGETSAVLGNIPANTAGANLFGALTVEIPHYAQASNNKAAHAAFAMKSGTGSGALQAGALSAFWRSSAAITQVTLIPGAGNFRSGSRATLYGLA